MGFFSQSQPFKFLCASVLASLLLGEGALATVKLNGTPSGASLVQSVTNEDSSVTTKVYAGFAGTCTGDGANTCNSCTGQPVTVGADTYTYSPCNQRNAYPNLNLTMELSVTNTAVTSSTPVLVKVGDQEISSGDMIATYSGGILTVSVPWRAICVAANGASASDCSGTVSKDLEVGFKNIGGSTSSTDTTTFAVITQSVTMTAVTDWFYDDCNTGTALKNFGFCHFETYPGDAKIYADNLVVYGSNYPKSNTSVDYAGLTFFYEEQLNGETNAQTIARITTASPSTSLSVNTRASPPLSDNRLTGLNNGSTYCFIMANRDLAGNLYYFTRAGTVTGARPDTELCGTPEKVVGLLDDKSCFIATAAWGSDMAPEVQSFRDFRNEFLFSNKAGKEFVRFYYKHSPYFANMIAQSDAARGVVRMALWPLLAFAKFSVAYGLWAGVLLLIASFGSLYVVARRFRLPSKSRGVA